MGEDLTLGHELFKPLGFDVQAYQHCLAKYTRRHRDLQRFGYKPRWNEVHEFRKGSICYIMESDVDQEIYSMPQYLASLQPSLLNESAMPFCRRYYTNGNHAGCRFDTYRLPGVDEPGGDPLK